MGKKCLHRELMSDMQQLLPDSVLTFYFSKNRKLYNCRKLKEREGTKLEINQQKNVETVKQFSLQERILLENITDKQNTEIKLPDKIHKKP